MGKEENRVADYWQKVKALLIKTEDEQEQKS